MSKDKMNVRVHHIEQVNAIQRTLRDREVVFFERYSPATAIALRQIINTLATGVNYLRPSKLGWRERSAEKQLRAYVADLGKPEDHLKARVLDNETFKNVSVLFDLLPSYQAAPAFDMTPPGGVAVIQCRLPFSTSREERDPATQRVIDHTIAIWESLNELQDAKDQRGLILLFC